MHIPTSLYTAMRFNFLYVDYYTFRKGWVYPESYVPYCMLRYIVKGTAVFEINGVPYEVHENQVSYIPEGCMLSCYTLEEELKFISIRFTTTVRLNDNDFLGEFFHIRAVADDDNQYALPLFMEVYQNAKSENLSRLFRIRGNLELILAWLVEQIDGTIAEPQDLLAADFSVEAIRQRETRTNRLKRDARIQMVVDYLAAHPTEPFDTKFFCDMTEMSASSLRRRFKEHTGKSPYVFVKELRMTTAARRLLATNERVSTIAYEVGYDDENYFARVFKSVFGVSPDQYRKGARE